MFAEELVKIYNFHTFDGIGGSGAISGKKNPRVSKLNLILNYLFDISRILTLSGTTANFYTFSLLLQMEINWR